MILKKVLPKIKTSLQGQMMLTLSGVMIGMVLLVGSPLVFISVYLQQQEVAREQQKMVDQAAQTLAELLQGLQTNQLQISLADVNDPDVSFIISQITTVLNLTISRASAQVQEVVEEGESFETLFSRNPQIYGLQRFDLEGTLQDSLWRDQPLVSDTLRPSAESLQLVQQGISTQDALFFTASHVPVLAVATPLMQAGQVEGLIITWTAVPGLWTYLTDLTIGETGYIYIIDQNGRLVSSPSPVSGQSPASTSTLSPTLTTAGGLSGPEGRLETGVYQGLNGEPVIGRLAPIENSPWRVVAEIPVAEANDRLRSLLIILSAILLFGVAVAISVARLFSRWLLQPIHVLHDSATRISEGDLAHRIALDREDELGFLASAFNQMVATLEQTINELRRVSLNLLSAQEVERRRIAREIHDELGQTLTALRLNLWMGLQKQPDNQILAAAHQQATAVQEKARTLSHELRPAMLDDLGLLPTLEWYIDRVEQRANLAIVLDTDLDEACLPSSIKTTLYRLVAEALTNITKHAQASVVEIKLTQEDQQLSLTISDDGLGFDTTRLEKTQSLGIAGMRERINLLHGDFLIQSKLGEGTQIAITLPWQG